MVSKKAVLKDFQRIPGVGPSIAQDFWNLGFRAVSELKRKDPEQLYRDLCVFQGQHVDRCMLYVFRCAVYFASHTQHDSHLLGRTSPGFVIGLPLCLRLREDYDYAGQSSFFLANSI